MARFYPRSGSRLFGNLATIVADRFTDKLARDALSGDKGTSRHNAGSVAALEAVYPEIASN